MLSIIIPVYNEEKTVATLINKVLNVNYTIPFEIIVINDGSTDGTEKELQKINDSRLKIINFNQNRGKGYAVRIGINEAKGDILIIQDADLEYDPLQIPDVINPILNGETKVVYGSRYLNEKLNKNVNKKMISHYLGNIIITKLNNILYKSNITDVETCYKAFSRDTILKLKLYSNRFEIEPEITAKLLLSGVKIKEVPIKVKPRGFNEGKKISWRDGIIAVYYLLKFKFIK